MFRTAALLLILIAGSCASSLGPPRNLNDACAMRAERPSWFNAMSRTEERWGVPVHIQLATMWHESKFVPNARTPRKYILGFIPNGRRSSAYGYAQAIDGTWDWYRESTGRTFARRNDFHDASDFIGWYMNQTRSRNGIPLTDAYRQYLAYHEGHSGYARGSYNSKSFLLRVARGVQNQANRYESQLAFCT